MANRPHSRNKRYTGTSGSFNKRPGGFTGNSGKSFSSGGGFRPTRGMRGGRTSPLLIIIMLILYFVMSNGTDFLGSSSNNNNYNGNYNNNYFGSNNQVDYMDVSTSELNMNVDKQARDKYTVVENAEDVTVMVYMCGSDLESNYGMATKDINEMLYAEIKDNINVVIQTGGAKKWNNNVVNSRYLQRYLVTSKGLKILDDKVRNAPMTESSTLTDFINFSKKNYPADRYILVMWDHGAGSVNGYGYDENYTSSGSMSIDEIQSAIKKSKIKFDIIGFDACLMATLETAIALEPYADYLIASEETEPGDGWYYTNWIKKLDNNPQIDSRELAKTLIDDYISVSRKTSNSSKLTLSLTDLSELHGTLDESLVDFASNLKSQLKGDDYQSVVDARAITREFSQASRLDQVDIVDFALKVNTSESKELANVIQNAVKYNRCHNMTNAYGLSIYFPYSALSKMNSMVQIYENIDMDETYSDAIKTFATMRSSGQLVANHTNSSSSSLINTLNGNNYSSYNLSSSDILSMLMGSMNSSNSGYSSILGGNSWIDSSMFESMSNYIGRNQIATDALTLTKKNGETVLELSEEEWELMKTIELNVFVDDGEGYFELGLDNVFEFNNNGDLIIDYDESWLSIDDQFVSYTLVSDEYIDDDNYTIIGKVPAYLNDERVDILLRFDDENPYGVVEGARTIYEIDTNAKGLIPIEKGDRIDFVCNYHDYNGKVEEVYLGETLIVDDELYIANKYIEGQESIYSYRLTDIYGNHYWTPTVK